MSAKPINPPLDPQMFQLGQHIASQPDFDPQEAMNLYTNTPYGQPSMALGPTNPPVNIGGWGPPPPPDAFGGFGGFAGPPPQAPPTQDDGANQFSQYFSSPQFRDSMMAGAIAIASAKNPTLGLQMAMQMREHQNQRAFQEQQAQLQRDSQQQMMRERAQIQKGYKDQAQFNSQSAKLDAALRVAGISPDPIMADLGPPSPDNIEQWKGRVQTAVAQQKAAQAAQKEATTDVTNKAKILSNIASTGTFIGSPYTTKGNPKYDADLAENQIPSLIADHKQQEQAKAEMRTARLEREKALGRIATKNADGTANPDKLTGQRLQKEYGELETAIRDYQSKLANAKATAAAFSSLDDTDPNKVNAMAAVANWSNLLADAQSKKEDNNSAFAELTGHAPKSTPAGQTPEDIQKDPDLKKILDKYPGARIVMPNPTTLTPSTTATPSGQPNVTEVLQRGILKSIEVNGYAKTKDAVTKQHPEMLSWFNQLPPPPGQ